MAGWSSSEGTRPECLTVYYLTGTTKKMKDNSSVIYLHLHVYSPQIHINLMKVNEDRDVMPSGVFFHQLFTFALYLSLVYMYISTTDEDYVIQ